MRMTKQDAIDKVVWLFIYKVIVDNLNNDHCNDAFMQSRAMEQVSDHYKDRFREFPETGERCYKIKETGKYYSRKNTIIDDVLLLTGLNQVKLAKKFKPPVSKTTLSQWKRGRNIPAKRIKELESWLIKPS